MLHFTRTVLAELGKLGICGILFESSIFYLFDIPFSFLLFPLFDSMLMDLTGAFTFWDTYEVRSAFNEYILTFPEESPVTR